MLMSYKDPLNTQDRFAQPQIRRDCLRIARRFATDTQEADDIAQEAMIRAWRHRSSLRDRDQLKPWLARIVRNEAFRMSSRRRPEPIGELDEIGEAGGEDAVIDRIDLQRAVATLSPDEQQLVCLRYLDDLTQPAIARALGLPEGTVKVRLHRARAKLHRALSEP
jgi:RNA polymerase sigma-70 factor (ECF subfamily)